MLESLFSKVAGLKGCNFIKQRLQHRCFPVNIVIFWEKLFYRTPLMAASELGKKYVIVVAKSMQATLKTSLKAHQQISKKKRCFENYCSCDTTCQFSTLQGTPWRSYLENPTIDDKFINKWVRHQTCVKRVEKEKLFGRHKNYICKITV